MWLLYIKSIKIINYKWHANTVWKKNTDTDCDNMKGYMWEDNNSKTKRKTNYFFSK